MYTWNFIIIISLRHVARDRMGESIQNQHFKLKIIGSAVQPAYIAPPQSAKVDLRPVARKLLLIIL